MPLYIAVYFDPPYPQLPIAFPFPLSVVERTPDPSFSTPAIAMTNPLPPLPNIRSAQTREQIFTHSSLTAKRRGEFEAPLDNPSRDNEE